MKSIFIMACCLAPIFVLAQDLTRRTSAPNVFLITIDTLRADHVHCYGYDGVQTPALDTLAKDGVRFSQAFTPSPITNTSHTTILTGLLPSSHGVTDFAVPLAASHRTWAELLKARGYSTAAFIGAVILDSHSLAPGLDRGFDFYDNFPKDVPPNARWGRVERRGTDVVMRAEKWLTAHPTGGHFVWVHLYDPHDPYEPPAPYSQIYKDHLYDGEIAYSDSALRNFLEYLRKHGWYENAIIIVVGDHGEGLGEHGEDTHGIFLYDSTTHVPLILKLSGNAYRGTVVEAQVRTSDILPTVLDLLAVAVQAKFDGESLTPLFENRAQGDRVAFGQTDYPMRFGWAPLRSVRTSSWKFIEAPRPELYDLRRDPRERHNSYVPWDKTVQTSRAMLAQIRATSQSAVPSPAAVPQQTVDELKALGYLGRADAGSKTDVPEPSLLPDPKDNIQEANLLHFAMQSSEDNRVADARAALEKVLKLDPGSPIALLQLGELELSAGEYANAAGHLKTAREIRPNDAVAAFREGQARQKMGDVATARDALESSLKIDPRQLQARMLLGEVFLELKEPRLAQDHFEAASLLDPSSVQAQLGVARAQIAEGDASSAVKQLSVLSEESKSPEILDILAQAFRSIGNTKQAQHAAARAKLLRQNRRQ